MAPAGSGLKSSLHTTFLALPVSSLSLWPFVLLTWSKRRPPAALPVFVDAHKWAFFDVRNALRCSDSWADCSVLLQGCLGAKQTYLNQSHPPQPYSILMFVGAGSNPSQLDTVIQRARTRIREVEDMQYATPIMNIKLKIRLKIELL